MAHRAEKAKGKLTSENLTTNLDTPRSVLAIGAHPDDIELNCGSTLAKWSAKGCEVHFLILTDGQRGSWDEKKERAGLVATRQQEQLAAYKVLCGLQDKLEDEEEVAKLVRTYVTFLSWPDGELEAGLRQRAEVCAVIRRTKPEIILGHDPWKRYRLHPDHRNAGFLTTDAEVAARDPLFFPEQRFAPHRPAKILLFESDVADHGEEISGFEDAKLSSLLQHESQLLSTMGIAASKSNTDEWAKAVQQFASSLHERHATSAKAFGLQKAEVFKVISDC